MGLRARAKNVGENLAGNQGIGREWRGDNGTQFASPNVLSRLTDTGDGHGGRHIETRRS
jgi:hypothetical protein